jgi:hypothetical protein
LKLLAWRRGQKFAKQNNVRENKKNPPAHPVQHQPIRILMSHFVTASAYCVPNTAYFSGHFMQ